MNYVIDTVAVIRHFSGAGKIGAKAHLPIVSSDKRFDELDEIERIW